MTLIDRQALREGRSDAMSNLVKAAHRVARKAASRYGVRSLADDIAQEITLSFLRANAKPREDEAQLHVEAFLKTAAIHRAVNYLGRAKRSNNVDDEETFDTIVGPDETRAEAGPDTDLDRDEEAARAKRTAARTASAAGRATKSRKKSVRRRTSRVKGVNPATKLEPMAAGAPVTYSTLRIMRAEWGLTQDQLARYLEITTHTLRNYEYKAVRPIPAAVAERIRDTFNSMVHGDYPRLSQQGFTAVANGWLRRLGHKSGDYRALADCLQKPRSTAWRWFNVPSCHPKRDDILKYQDMVNALVERTQRHVEAVTGGKPKARKKPG